MSSGQVKKRMKVSFSGGKTSAFMGKYLLDNHSDEYEFAFVFANTGQEDERTLEFVRNCDSHFGFNTTWIEAVVNPRHGARHGHRVVDFDSANRDGAVYEAYVAKDGVPNKVYPHCTRDLKLRPMESYMRSIGWARGTYDVAVGIRADEGRRVSKNATRDRIVYPLVDMRPTDKLDVIEWWEDQPFQLGLPEHRGNCTWCWKKSLKKHIQLLHETPDALAFPARMEAQYGFVKPTSDGRPRVFFRECRSALDVMAIASAMDFRRMRATREEENSGCSESCEIYEMEPA